MTTHIKSQSTNTTSSYLLRQFIVPSLLQVILYLLIAGCLMVLFNARDIWEAYEASIPVTPAPAGGNDASTTGGIGNDLANSIVPQLVFWGAIGLIMYVVVWFVWSAITNLRNDLVADSYVHPKHYDRGKYWHAVFARKAFFAVLVLIFIAYFLVMYQLLIIISDLSYASVSDWSFPVSLMNLALHIAVIALLIHVFLLLLQLSARAWKAIYKDL